MIPTKFSLTILLLALTSTLSRPLVREVRTDREFQRLLKVSIQPTNIHQHRKIQFLIHSITKTPLSFFLCFRNSSQFLLHQTY